MVPVVRLIIPIRPVIRWPVIARTVIAIAGAVIVRSIGARGGARGECASSQAEGYARSDASCLSGRGNGSHCR